MKSKSKGLAQLPPISVPAEPVAPSQYQRRATPVTAVFCLPDSPDRVSWPAWAIRPGTLGYRGSERVWVVRDCDVMDHYDRPRGLAKGDWLYLENGVLRACNAGDFQRLFEPIPPPTVSLLRYVPGLVQYDEMAISKEGLPEDNLMSHYRRDNERTLSCLLLTGEGGGATLATVAAWTHGQCVDAEIWALHEHVHASDNDDVPRLPMPEHVRALSQQITTDEVIDKL